MPTTHLASAEAYKIKESAGGGFRGVARNKLSGATYRGEVRDSLEAARNDAKRAVWTWADGRNMNTGTFRNTPRVNWRMNFFIRTDEVADAERAIDV
jgi:hypothetical protein